METQNLIALRDFLLQTNVAFSMREYRQEAFEDDDGDLVVGCADLLEDEVLAGVHECKSAGCAIGWAPFVVPPRTHHYGSGGDLDFRRYAQDMLLPAIWETNNPIDETPEYISMFSSQWSDQDDTREGAAFRIDSFLNGTLYVPFENEHAYATERARWLSQRRAPTL